MKFQRFFLFLIALSLFGPPTANASVVFEGVFQYSQSGHSFDQNYPYDETATVGFMFEFEHGLNGVVNAGSPGLLAADTVSFETSTLGAFTDAGPDSLSWLSAIVDTDSAGGYQLDIFQFAFDSFQFVKDTGELYANTLNITNNKADLSGYYKDASHYPLSETYDVLDSVTITNISEVHDHAPPVGSIPTDPILPADPPSDCAEGDGCFAIPVTIDPDGVGAVDPVFIDPVVAVGYEYYIDSPSGVAFDSVVVPEQGQLLNGTLLELIVNNVSWDLVVGTSFDFFGDAGILDVTDFVIKGIDENLGLDPYDTSAFVTGLTFEEFGGSPLTATTGVDVIMVPLTLDTSAQGSRSAPEPSVLVLLTLGLAGIGISGCGKSCDGQRRRCFSG